MSSKIEDDIQVQVAPPIESMERDERRQLQPSMQSGVTGGAPELYTKLSFFESCVSTAVKTVCCPFFPCYLTVVRDFERVVVLRFGKLFSAQAGAGGLYVIWPGIDTARRVDIRERIINVPSRK